MSTFLEGGIISVLPVPPDHLLKIVDDAFAPTCDYRLETVMFTHPQKCAEDIQVAVSPTPCLKFHSTGGTLATNLQTSERYFITVSMNQGRGSDFYQVDISNLKPEVSNNRLASLSLSETVGRIKYYQCLRLGTAELWGDGNPNNVLQEFASKFKIVII